MKIRNVSLLEMVIKAITDIFILIVSYIGFNRLNPLIVIASMKNSVVRLFCIFMVTCLVILLLTICIIGLVRIYLIIRWKHLPDKSKSYIDNLIYNIILRMED